VVVGPVGLVGELLKALEEVETPILAVWGELDEISSPSNAQVLRGRNVKTAMLRGAGHAAYLDKPKEFVELLLEFLGSVY
jgi:pimeloyl-ACP methyl ester carboxylesterase